MEIEIEIAILITTVTALAVATLTWLFASKKANRLVGDVAIASAASETVTVELNLLTASLAKLDAQHDKVIIELSTVKQINAAVGQEVTSLKDERDGEGKRIVKLEGEKVELQSQLILLASNNAELKTSQKERDESHAREVLQFETQKKELLKEFENLANKIFEEKGKTFTQTSETTLNSLLKPFREQIDGFQKRVNEVHDQSTQGNANIGAEIKKVLDVGIKMRDEASNLSTALRGDKKAQGNWSEQQAEQLLEMSGLHKDREYQREANYKTDEGKNQRPDFIINLPNDKHIIIDSKMSLNAYVSATAASTEEEKLAYLKQHAEAVRKHARDLSDKNYPKLKGINSPEYIFMFIGNEPAYLAAYDADPNLFQDAYSKGVAIVTPNTLLSSLTIVSHLWSIDKQNSNTRDLAEQAARVYDKLRVFVGKMEKLGNQINTVSNSFDDSWGTLKDGSGSLTKQVHKFVDMGVAVKEKLPSSVTSGDDDLPLLASNGQ
jgi:DNA recombination protein RmuC